MKEKKSISNLVDFSWYAKKLVGCSNHVMDAVLDKPFLFVFDVRHNYERNIITKLTLRHCLEITHDIRHFGEYSILNELHYRVFES